MNQNKAYKSLKYSIRQCGKDEIEIRNSFFDGYTRGFIRLLFIGVFAWVGIKMPNTKSSIFLWGKSNRRRFYVDFNKDSRIKPLYDEYREWVLSPETKKNYPNEKLQSYEEYKKLYTEESWAKWHIIRTFLHPIWMAFLLFFILSAASAWNQSQPKKTD